MRLAATTRQLLAGLGDGDAELLAAGAGEKIPVRHGFGTNDDEFWILDFGLRTQRL
jgi:hypothetical protein